MGYISKLVQDATTAHSQPPHNSPQISTFDLTTHSTKEHLTTSHKHVEWLGEHEVISIIFIGLIVVATLLIAALYYTYKYCPCFKSCRKETPKPAPKIEKNISQIFPRPADPGRAKVGRCGSDDSIQKVWFRNKIMFDGVFILFRIFLKFI